jgi:hypothetical protein
MRSLLLALLCFPSTGCQVVLDIQEFPSGFGGASASATATAAQTTASDASGSTSTGGPACGLEVITLEQTIC